MVGFLLGKWSLVVGACSVVGGRCYCGWSVGCGFVPCPLFDNLSIFSPKVTNT